MNKLAYAVAAALSLMAGAVSAQQVTDFGDEERWGTFNLGNFAKFNVGGFAIGEYARNTNRSTGLVNCNYTPDPRGVLGKYCQPGGAQTASGKPLNLYSLSAGLSHEFDSAWKLDSKITTRSRDGAPDIYGYTVVEKNVAASHPVYGELRAGTMLTRSWSRSDSFTYPIGMSSAWSETGAGFGVIKEGVRYTAAPIEIRGSKLVLEGTFGTNSINYAHNSSTVSYNERPPRPKLGEFFAQYANEVNLIELVVQTSRGGLQSSFAKGAFVGDVGNADNLNTYSAPHENVVILQGDHYFNPSLKLTLGAKRSYWSGTNLQCDYVKSVGCYFSNQGFNYDSTVNTSSAVSHSAKEYDFMAGLSYFQGPWTYTAGLVRLNKAYTKTPTEWGQSNNATDLHLGVYRKVPEISQNLQVYGGLGYVRFGSHNPAPTSMANETAVWGVDPRNQTASVSATLGAVFKF